MPLKLKGRRKERSPRRPKMSGPSPQKRFEHLGTDQCPILSNDVNDVIGESDIWLFGF